MDVYNQTTQDIYFGPLHLGAGISTHLVVDDTSATSLYLTDDAVADALNNAYLQNKITVANQATPFPRPTGTPQLLHGDGSPEGLVYASQGSLYMRRDGSGANSLYVKTTGVTIPTGWLAFGSAVGGAGTEWDYAQITANVAVSGTTEATATSIVSGNTVTYDGTRVAVEVFLPYVSGTASSGILHGVFLRDSTVVGQANYAASTMGIGSGVQKVFDTPAAGAHTYKFSGFTLSGTPTVNCGPGGSGTLVPAYLRVTKA